MYGRVCSVTPRQAQEALDELSGESVLDLDVDREERLIKGLTDILGENKVTGRMEPRVTVPLIGSRNTRPRRVAAALKTFQGFRALW